MRATTLPRQAALVCGAALLGLLCARLAISHYAIAVLGAVVAIPLLVSVARRPGLGLVLLLAVDASLFAYGLLPRVVPGQVPINVADVLLAVTVGGTLWRRRSSSWPPVVRCYAAAIAVVLFLALVPTIKTALIGHSEARDALYAYRNLLYLTVALTIALELVRERLWSSMLNATTILAAALAAISILAAVSPSVAHAIAGFATGTVDPSLTVQAPGPAARVRIVGLFFIYAMILPTFVQAALVKDHSRPWRLASLVLMVGAVGVSLNRNMYVGLVVGAIVTAILGGARIRFRLALVAIAASLTIGLAVFSAVTPAITSEVGHRASSLLAPSALAQSGSLQDRAYEDALALHSIASHPWFGVGPRQSYGAVVQNGPVSQVRFFVQNLYLDLATDYGIPLAVAFVCIPFICIAWGTKRLRAAEDQVQRATLAAAIGTVVAMLVSCLVGTYVQGPETTVPFAFACGLVLAAGLRIDSTTNREAFDVHAT